MDTDLFLKLLFISYWKLIKVYLFFKEQYTTENC